MHITNGGAPLRVRDWRLSGAVNYAGLIADGAPSGFECRPATGPTGTKRSAATLGPSHQSLNILAGQRSNRLLARDPRDWNP